MLDVLPPSISSFSTVFLQAAVSWVIARTLIPWQSRWRARSSLVSLNANFLGLTHALQALLKFMLASWSVLGHFASTKSRRCLQ